MERAISAVTQKPFLSRSIPSGEVVTNGLRIGFRVRACGWWEEEKDGSGL